MSTRCDRCGKSGYRSCQCREFFIKIPDWYGDDTHSHWSYDAETAVEEFVEKEDAERDLLNRHAPLVVQVAAVQDENPIWVWETFEVFAEATVEYKAYARE